MSNESKNYIESISVSSKESIALESETVNQAASELWICIQKKIFIRKRNFESLVGMFLKPKSTEELAFTVREDMNHGKNIKMFYFFT